MSRHHCKCDTEVEDGTGGRHRTEPLCACGKEHGGRQEEREIVEETNPRITTKAGRRIIRRGFNDSAPGRSDKIPHCACEQNRILPTYSCFDCDPRQQSSRYPKSKQMDTANKSFGAVPDMNQRVWYNRKVLRARQKAIERKKQKQLETRRKLLFTPGDLGPDLNDPSFDSPESSFYR